MGENYTRKTENYTRTDRNQNTQNQPKSTAVVYTCWRCHKNFDLPTAGRPDGVRCPHCEMVHGLITSK